MRKFHTRLSFLPERWLRHFSVPPLRYDPQKRNEDAL